MNKEYQTMTKETKTICPRCDSALVTIYDEHKCRMCGYVDYSYTPPATKIEGSFRASVIGVKETLRYIGAYSVCADVLLHISLQSKSRLVDGNTKASTLAIFPVCPFCHHGMNSTTSDSKSREKNECRFLCREGHRVSVVSNRSGMIGWK